MFIYGFIYLYIVLYNNCIDKNILSILLLDFIIKYSAKYIYFCKKKNVFFNKIIKYLLIFNISY